MTQHAPVLESDLAKRVFHVVGRDARGKVGLSTRRTREALLPHMAPRPSMLIGMEAGGAHDWARWFRAHGHTVPLMAPQFVKSYGKANQHDPADAEAIGAAVRRPTMRCGPIKEVEQ